MKKWNITTEVTAHQDDKSGRWIIRFQPIIKPLMLATGELRTAYYEAWLDEPETIETQKQAAENNAVSSVISLFS